MIEVSRTNILCCLRYLASYDFQKVAWFENDQGLSSSFDQDVEDIFCFTNLNLAFENKETVFGKDADAALKELESACDALGYQWSGREKELLESRELAVIREMAKKCLQYINDSDLSESTVELIDDEDPPGFNVVFPDMKYL